MPAGKLRGRVVADGDYPTKGLTVHVRAMSTPNDDRYSVLEYVDSPPVPLFLASEADVITDSDGRFEIPEMACGWLSIDLPGGLNKPYQYQMEEPVDCREAMAKELTLQLRKAVHVHGKCQLIGSNAKLTQFRIGCTRSHKPSSWYPGYEFFVNVDDKGRFEFYSLPGEVSACVDDRKEPELDRFPDWAVSEPEGWNRGCPGMENDYWHSDVHWRRTDPRKDVAL